MLEFKDYKYTRPDYEKVKTEIDALVQKMNNAETSSDALSTLKEFNKTYNTVVSDIALVEIRNSIDMADKFYEKEMNFIIEYMPKFDELKNHMNKAIVNSKFVKNIKGQYGEQFVNLLEAQIKCFDPCIMPELVLEGKVCNEYNKLISSAKIEFDGKTL
ncbi:MAG: M3 family oligoendopeptidase, partial [Bacilli bacterium]